MIIIMMMPIACLVYRVKTSIRNLADQIKVLKLCPGLCSEVTNVSGKNGLLSHGAPCCVGYKNNLAKPFLSETNH